MIVFPVRNPPGEGQSLRDYIHQLAEDMGWYNKRAFYKRLNIVASDLTWIHGSKTYNQLIDELGRRLLKQSSELYESFKHEAELKVAASKGVGIPSRIHKHPRFCRSCILDNPFIKSDWLNTTKMHCEKHMELLTDTCPVCTAKYSWEADHRFHCECGYSYLQPYHPQNNDFQLDKYVPLIEKIGFNTLQETINFIARPLDHINATVQINELRNEDLYFLVKISCRYLTDNNYKDRFDNMAMAACTNAFKKSGVLLSCQGWRTKESQNWSANSTSIVSGLSDSDPNQDFKALLLLSEKYRMSWVTPKRYKHVKKIDTHDLIFQVNTEQLARYLSLGANDIGKLTSGGFIKPIRPMRTTRDMLFDLRTIRLELSCKPLDNISDPISWKKILHRKYFRIFNASLADVVEALLSGRMQAYSSNQASVIGDISVSRNELYTYLEGCLLESDKDISIKSLSGVLGVPADITWHLVREKHLYTNHWQKPCDENAVEVKSHSIKVFMQQFTCANRIARLYETRYDAIVNYLANHSVLPSLSYPGSAFYNRSGEIEVLLASLIYG